MGFLKKITKPFKKAAKKLVPKELAGIMQVAAPFIGGPAAPFIYAAGAYKQSGRINPIALASMALPYVGYKPGEGLSGLRYGNFNPVRDNMGALVTKGKYGVLGEDVLTARDFLGLRDASGIRGTAEDFLFGGYGIDDKGRDIVKRGILGDAGKFNPREGFLVKKQGSNKLNFTNIAAAAAAGLSLTQTQQQIEEEGEEAGLGSSELAALQAEAAEMWKDFDTTAFKPNVKDGGLMRLKLREGSEGNELPPDPTTPVNPFKPKPIGPVLPNKAEAIDVDILRQMFMEALRNGDIPPGTDFDTYKDMMMTLMSKTQAKKGGLMRSNFALGTEPTKEESGLGGLPIEADMRYSGGFMPYGAKEKADDVPARLSKNEFVFTADAVRAAGGGSVQKGAQKMYNTMKQLESMGAMV